MRHLPGKLTDHFHRSVVIREYQCERSEEGEIARYRNYQFSPSLRRVYKVVYIYIQSKPIIFLTNKHMNILYGEQLLSP